MKVQPKFDKETLRQQYENVCSKHERLGKNLKEALEVFVKEAQIDHIGVFSRIKDFESFWKKIHKKGYDKPFAQTEDICGLRVVCLYVSDMDRIKQIISKEFDVIEWVDKRKELKPNGFGYLSLHAIVIVKKDWLNAPNYRGLKEVKAEIQIRTTLMHAWAEIEHKLAYKNNAPSEFRSQFNPISKQLEGIDKKFDKLRKEWKSVNNELSQEDEKLEKKQKAKGKRFFKTYTPKPSFTEDGICRIRLENLPKQHAMEELIDEYVTGVERLPYSLKVIYLDITSLIHMDSRARQIFNEFIIQASRQSGDKVRFVFTGGSLNLRRYIQLLCKGLGFGNRTHFFETPQQADVWAKKFLDN